ncbi:MAG: DNA translocase FtsK 4TM domain-containing protein, partial [Verrucomicrobiota bacterium]
MKNTSFEKKSKVVHPEARGLILLALTVIVLLSLISFRFDAPHQNWLGLIGWGLGFGFNYLFGISSYLIVGFGLWLGWKLILNQKPIYMPSKLFCFLILCFSCCFLLNLLAENKWAYAKLFENRV